jgi:4a-hydroxytetrahydrobiopterin dehydratase
MRLAKRMLPWARATTSPPGYGTRGRGSRGRAAAEATLLNRCSHGACGPWCSDETPARDADIAAWLRQLPGWTLIEQDGVRRLQRVFNVADFTGAMAFADRVGAMAEAAGHHPALLTEWGRVTVTWCTHRARGLHRDDFVMAARTDQAYANCCRAVSGPGRPRLDTERRVMALPVGRSTP